MLPETTINTQEISSEQLANRKTNPF